MASKKVDPAKQQKKGASKDKPEKKKDPKKWTASVKKEKVQKNAVTSQELFSKIKKEVSTMNVVTPATISSKYNFLTSVSKRILEEIVSTGELQVLASSSFGTVYGSKKSAGKAKEEEKGKVPVENKA